MFARATKTTAALVVPPPSRDVAARERQDMRGGGGHVLIGKRHADAGAPDMRGVGPHQGDRPSQLLGQLGVQRPEAA